MNAKEFVYGAEFFEGGINGVMRLGIILIVNGDGNKGSKMRLDSGDFR